MTFTLHHIVAILAAVALALPLRAAEFVNSNTLSNLHVYAIEQDSLGYIWVATANGLCRHLGDSYDVFYCNQSDTTSLPSNNTTGLFYKHPNLWVSTGRGVASKDIHSKRFIRYSEGDSCDGFFRGFVEFQGDIYAYGFGGIYSVNQDRRKLEKVFSFPYSSVNTVVVTGDGAIWAASNQRLAKLNSRFKPVSSTKLPPECVINAIVPHNNILYLGTTDGLKVYDPSTEKISPAISDSPYNKMVVNSLLRIDADHILVNTRGGGQFFFDAETGSCSLKSTNFNLDNVQDEDISAAYIDSNKKLWLGTFDRGILKAHDYTSMFNADIKLENAFKGNFVTRISADNNNRLWIGTRYAGLQVYDRNTGTVTPSPLPASESFIQHIFRDSRNRLWVGFNESLAVGSLSPESTVLVNMHKFDNVGNVVSAAEDTQGNVWFGTSDNGIIVYRPDLSQKVHIIDHLFQSNNIPQIIPLSPDEMLVAAYTDGIYVVDTKTFEARPLSPKNRRMWITAVDMFLDKDMRLWVGTYDNGLVLYDFNTDTARRYSDFQSYDIVAVNEDAGGNIWLGTSNGLYRLNYKTGEIHSYLRGPGILGTQYHEKGSCRAADGSLYFGGNAGVQQITPAYSTELNSDISVYLTSVVPLYKGFSQDDEIKDTEVAFLDNITLSHRNNGLIINYAALDYSQPVEYAYMLEGYDKEWIESGDYTRSVYSNLPPGSYRFLVKTRVRGVWNEPVCLLKIRLKEAPWLHPLAIAAYVLIVILLILLLIKLYIHLKLEKERISLAEKRVIDEQTIAARKINFFHNISHELRTPLTLISAPMKQLQSNFRAMKPEDVERDLKYMDSNVRRLLSLTTQILNFREVQGETLPLAVSSGDVTAQCEQIVSLFNIYAAEKGISIDLVCHIIQKTVFYDADKFEKMLNNLLFNAVKYTPDGGHVTVRLELTRHPECAPAADGVYLELAVSDDGVGIGKGENMRNIFTRFSRLFNSSKVKAAGFGIGLDFVKKIVTIHHGYIVGRPNAIKGMTFIIDIPVEESAYAPEEFLHESPAAVTAVNDENAAVLSGSIPVNTERSVAEEESAKPKLLVVEDQTDLQEFIASLFHDDFEVFCAANGSEGLAMVRDELPDLIISDLMMPIMGGMDMINTLKNDLVTSHIPVIVLTAKNCDSDQIESYDTGAVLYMSKPFNPEVLKAAALSIIANIERQRQTVTATAGTTDEPVVEVSQLGGLDRKFLENLYAYINDNLSNTELNVNFLGRELGFSRSNFYRKVKALTGETPNDMLRIYRLNRAAEMLKSRSYSIGEIADLTGFATQSHFSSLFKKHFGMTPSEYVHAAVKV